MFRALIALAVLAGILLVLKPWGGSDGSGGELSKAEILREGESEMVARGISPAAAACIAAGADRDFTEEQLQDAGDAFSGSLPKTIGEATPSQLAVIAKVARIGVACGSSP